MNTRGYGIRPSEEGREEGSSSMSEGEEREWIGGRTYSRRERMVGRQAQAGSSVKPATSQAAVLGKPLCQVWGNAP